MFLLLVISISSFSLLNFSQTAIRVRKTTAISSLDSSKKKKISPTSEDPFKFKTEPNKPYTTSKNELIQNSTVINNIDFVQAQKDKMEKIILLTYIFWLSFICYGVLPGLQSYSTLPYGILE